MSSTPKTHLSITPESNKRPQTSALPSMVRQHAPLDTDKDMNDAAWEAARGAVAGAARWGLYSGLAGAAAWVYSPVYRGFTLQFKVFIQMAGMTMGSMIEADRRLIAHEALVRRQRRIARDAEVWRRYEQDFEDEEQDQKHRTSSAQAAPSEAASTSRSEAVPGTSGLADDVQRRRQNDSKQ